MRIILSSEFCFALLEQKLPTAVFAEVKELPISYVREIYAEVLDPMNMLTDFKACWVRRIKSLNRNTGSRSRAVIRNQKWANAFSELKDSADFLRCGKTLRIYRAVPPARQPIQINFFYNYGYASEIWDPSYILRTKFEENINWAYRVIISAFQSMHHDLQYLPPSLAADIEAIILPVYLDLLRGSRKI